MTFREAAIQALKSTDNEPKSARELWEIIDEQDLYESDGKTPWATLNVVLRRHSDDPYDSVKEEGVETIFRCEGSRPARFRLTERHAILDEPIEDDTFSEAEEEKNTVSTLTQIAAPEVGWEKIIVSDNSGNLQYKLKECNSYTYIATGDPDKRIDKVKIGTTTVDPDSRANNMRTSNPDIRVICAFPSEMHTENNLHSRFDNSRSKGEWFYYTKDIKTLVEDYKDLSQKVVDRFKIEDKIKNLDSEIIELA